MGDCHQTSLDEVVIFLKMGYINPGRAADFICIMEVLEKEQEEVVS